LSNGVFERARNRYVMFAQGTLSTSDRVTLEIVAEMYLIDVTNVTREQVWQER